MKILNFKMYVKKFKKITDTRGRQSHLIISILVI